MKLSLQQLSERADVPGRTVRFYIQRGLLPGPEGEKRGAYYTDVHLADLLRIRQWQDAGLSLDAIAGLLQARREPPVAPARPGAVEVCTRLIVADGLELVVVPERAGLTQVQLRSLFRSVQDAYEALCDPISARRIPTLPPAPSADAKASTEGILLSERERKILQLLARGCTNREIAKLTWLSRLTIDGYTKAIYRKLAVGSRAAAVFEAQKLGLLQ